MQVTVRIRFSETLRPSPLASVSNESRTVSSSGQRSVTLTAEAVPASSDEAVAVDIGPGTTATESVTVRFSEPGEYDLVLAGEAVKTRATGDGPILGSVTVTDQAETSGDDGTEFDAGDGVGNGDDGAPGSADDGGGSSPELSEFDLSDLAGLAALVGIVLATLFLIRRAPR